MSHPLVIMLFVAPCGVTDFPDCEDNMDADNGLDECMEAMATGDSAFLFTFHERFGPKINWLVRDIVRSMGRVDVLADSDEIDGLVLDACEVIFNRSAGWRTGGALPWNWAKMAIRSRVAAGIGHRVVELDEECSGVETVEDGDGIDVEVSGASGQAVAPNGDAALKSDIAAVGAADQRVGLLDLAIRSVGSERNQQICWHYGIQKGLGDPSPSITIASMFGVTDGNARQIYHRHMVRVEALIQSDVQFESIRHIEWFAA